MAAEEKPLDEMNLEELAQQKIDARLRLLKMDPKEAQAKVNEILFPHLWKPVDEFEWEDDIEPETESHT